MCEEDVIQGRRYGETFDSLLDDSNFDYYLGASNPISPQRYNDIIARKELFAQMVAYVTDGKVTNDEFNRRVETLFPNSLEFARKLF